MKRKPVILILSVLCCVFLLSGCSGKPKGSGPDQNLFVVCDQDNWQWLEPALRNTFERTIITPQSEKMFEVHWVSPENFNHYATRSNLIILGILNSGGEINKQVDSMLAPGVKDKVLAGESFYFTKESPWAREQLLLVLAATDPEILAQKLESNKTQLYNLFYERYNTVLKTQMYAREEQTELAEEILAEFGWTLRIQHDYMIEHKRPESRFLMLRRSLPGIERWLFVHWIEDGDPAMINKAWVVNTRNGLTSRFYEYDQVEEQYLEHGNVMFAGRPAYLVKGLWANEEKVTGGPFRNYTFYDSASNRIYMIDAAVWHPSGEKAPYLRQLDIMSQTFRTAMDITNANEEDKS